MGVYIKGVEIPKDGAHPYWVTIHSDGTVEYNENKGQGWQTSEAVPVPPHGDLIDRDWTLKQIRPWSPEDEYAACTFDTVKKLMHTLLNDSPTIIQAEEATQMDGGQDT